MTHSESVKFLILRSFGNFLLLFALYGVGATFGPVLYQESRFRIEKARGVEYAVAQEGSSSFAEILEKQKNNQQNNAGFAEILTLDKQRILVPQSSEFGIIIPKIGANAKIIPNVNPTDEKEFLPILQKGIAHAKGTVFPGIKGNTYLFAHSTDSFWNVGRYNAVFYLLKDLEAGDEIVLFFENRRYDYAVKELKVVDAKDVSYLVDSQKETEETLILQTCWPPGTTWKRLIVKATPKKV